MEKRRDRIEKNEYKSVGLCKIRSEERKREGR